MNYLVMLGSDMFYGTNGIITVQVGNRLVEFLRIREIFKVRSTGSYLAVDCDIKDSDNIGEVKLVKSKPVVQSDDITSSFDIQETVVKRKDGSIIIKVEQLDLNNIPLPGYEPVKKALSLFPNDAFGFIMEDLNSISIDAVIKITGDFYAGQYHLIIRDDNSTIDGYKTGGNLLIGTQGMELTNRGFIV